MTYDKRARELIDCGYKLIESKAVKADPDFKTWHDGVLALLGDAFGVKSEVYKWFSNKHFYPLVFYDEEKHDEAGTCARGIQDTIDKLKELFIEE